MNFDLLLNLNRALLLITLGTHLGLASFIYFYNPKKEINRSFGIMLFSVAFWAFSFMMLLFVKSPGWVLFYRRLAPAAAAFIGGSLLYFSLVFPDKKETLALWKKITIFLPAFIILGVAVFSRLMIRQFIFTDVEYLFMGTPVFGWFYYVFTVYFLASFLTALGIFFRSYFTASSPIEKVQVWYVLFGVFSAGILAVIVSLLLPLLGISGFYSFGPPFTIITGVCISYAIEKYRLLQVEEFLIRITGLMSMLVAAMGTIFCLIFLDGKFVFPFYVMLGNLTLGLVVFLRNPKAFANKIFLLLTALVFCWTLSILIYGEAGGVGQAFLGSKLAAVFAILIAITFFFFAYYFPKSAQTLGLNTKLFLFLPVLAVIVLVGFDLIIAGVTGSPGDFTLITGPWFWFYLLSFAGFMGGGLSSLYKKYCDYTGLVKMQIRYVFLGFILGSIPPFLTNIIMPLFGNSSLAAYGPLFTIITLIFIAYTIVRHRLMGIEFVLQRGLIYSLLSIFAMFVYGVVLFLLGEALRVGDGDSTFILVAFTSVILAISFQPLLRWLEGITDRFFFKGHYDYQRTIQDVSQAITSVIKLEEIVRLVVSTYIETMRVKEISFLVLDRERGRFKSMWLEIGTKGSQYKVIEIDERSPIVTWLKTKKDVLVRDELERGVVNEENKEIKGILEEVYEEAERLEVAVWVPIVSRGEIIGLISLGEKMSGDVFTTEDIRLLKTLSSQIAVGIENTALYEEVLSVKNYTENILMSMVNGVMTMDLAGDIITFNYMSERLTGLRTKDVVGRTVQDVFGKDSIIIQVMESTLKDRCYSNFEAELAAKVGAKTPINISSTLIRDNHGKRRGVLISLTDVSEVRELEGKVRQADKLAALGTMAAGMAHEIKNPLSSIKVLTQLLPLKFNEEEYRGKFSEIMPKEIERIDRIVESLLGFARAASPKFENIHIESVIKDTLDYYQEKMQEEKVVLEQHIEEVPVIVGDFGQLSQVFSNLVLNAVQAMKGGGKLTVRVRKSKRTAEGVDTVAVEIIDTGKGIDKETLSKLFDPFYTTKYGGTGLGLTISHSIVNGHKGFIDVKSEFGKGTVFMVVLPVRQ